VVAGLRAQVVLPVEQGAGGGDGGRGSDEGDADGGDEGRQEEEEDVALGHVFVVSGGSSRR